MLFFEAGLVVHIPHSKTVIPLEYKELFLLPDDALHAELLRMTDLYTDELFDISDAQVIFPISRLVCDVERFREEQQEIMTRKGMWVCYTKTSDNKPLKEVNAKHKEEILEKYYDAHHRKLTDIVDLTLQAQGSCLLIDAHSFPSEPLPYEISQSRERPDICIGTDSYHTPWQLIEAAKGYFKERGYVVALNSPFNGCLVPQKHYHKNPNLFALMLEINRKLYMDEKTGAKKEAFLRIKSDIASFFKAPLPAQTTEHV
ncbi:MAG: N-formylglutamate amidohydrolase [Christensenellaceae bacterium]|nr:N-formylglutamate amidohydrolase [Christensenellaceae bacterium]